MAELNLVKENLAQEVARLKQQPGKNIGVAGSPTLVYSLLQNDLLDELILMVHPVIVGSGKRLFKDGGDLKRLQLVAFRRRPLWVSRCSPTSPAAARLNPRAASFNSRSAIKGTMTFQVDLDSVEARTGKDG